MVIVVIEYAHWIGGLVGMSFRLAGNEGVEERGKEKTRPETAGTQKREGKVN